MSIKAKLGIVSELFKYLWQQKLWWIIPLVSILVLLGLILVLAQGSAVAPFIYTLF